MLGEAGGNAGDAGGATMVCHGLTRQDLDKLITRPSYKYDYVVLMCGGSNLQKD